jgi:hypothetical protein
MSAMSGRLQRDAADVLVYAYKTLVLFFLFISALRLIFYDGGWINDFIVFLILSCPIALVPVYRRLQRKQRIKEAVQKADPDKNAP